MKQTLALHERGRRIGVRIEEDVDVIESGAQAQRAAAQQSIAEDVTTHVTDADDGEHLVIGGATESAEVLAHAFPRAARGDGPGGLSAGGAGAGIWFVA